MELGEAAAEARKGDGASKKASGRLVIFGCGYVGAAVARAARARGVDVTALTRNEAKAHLLRGEGVRTVVADLASEAWHAEIGGAPDWALNCVSSGGAGVEGYRHSYAAGMDSIVRWAERAGAPGTVVYTSSTSVYPQDGGVVVDETAETPGENERAKILLEAEARLREAKAARGRWFVLRLAGIYGPGRHHLLEQVRQGEVAGMGDHRLNLIHRDDIVSAVMACCAAPESLRDEVFNVADDGPAAKREVVKWLAERLGVVEPRFTGMPASGRRAVTPDRIIANAKARAVLGWRPRYATFREGYAAMLSG